MIMIINEVFITKSSKIKALMFAISHREVNMLIYFITSVEVIRVQY